MSFRFIALAGLLATVTLAACGGADQPPAPTPTPRTARVAATPSPSPSRPTPAQSSRPGCDVEIDIECPPGLEDGCAQGRTTTSVCVLVGATALEPCDAGALLTCPAGMLDACAGQPRYSDRHVCVRP